MRNKSNEKKYFKKAYEKLYFHVYAHIGINNNYSLSLIHILQGLKYKNILSDGANVGYNGDSTVGPGEKITYEWYADREGIFYFSDMGDTRFSEKGTNIHLSLIHISPAYQSVLLKSIFSSIL